MKLSLILAAIILVNNLACASNYENNPIIPPDPAVNISLNSIDNLLSGPLNDIVFFSDIEKAMKDINSNVRDNVNNLLKKINQILLTSYRTSSKEYRRKCNFLQMSVYLSSLNKSFDDIEKCRDRCNESELKRIKYHLEYDYRDLYDKALSCRTYLDVLTNNQAG